jgi:hypothetical protein
MRWTTVESAAAVAARAMSIAARPVPMHATGRPSAI